MADETPKTPADQAKALWTKLSMRQRIVIGGVLAATIAGIAAITMRTEAPKESVLFSDLPADEAGSIVKELDAAKVAYRLDHGGSTIMVPEAKLAELRLHMANAGLPQGGGYGFKDFTETSPLNRTKFGERVAYQRGLSGELARSIGNVDAVERARVILAFPEERTFKKDQAPNSASVVLTLRRGQELNPKQVKAIVHLVSTSVERLQPANISVVDDRGNALWSGDEDGGDADVGQRDLERTLSKRITDITERIVGPRSAVVSVTSELDHSRTERTEESYDKDRMAVRSQSRSEELVQGNNNGAGGIAGTRSNLPGTNPGVTDSAATATNTERKKVTETQNNEISRVVAVTHGPKVSLKRLHVAVLVDGVTEADAPAAAPIAAVAASTVASSSTALAALPLVPAKKSKKVRVWSKAQLDQIALLAREAAGLDPARGDRIEVHCAPFHSDEEEELALPPPPPVPAWKKVVDEQPLVVAAAAGALLFLALVVAAVVLLKRRRQKRRELIEPIAMPALPLRAAEVDQVLAGEVPTPAAEPTPELADPRVLALEAAKADPVRAARILSAWLAESMPAAALPNPTAHAVPTAHTTEGASR